MRRPLLLSVAALLALLAGAWWMTRADGPRPPDRAANGSASTASTTAAADPAARSSTATARASSAPRGAEGGVAAGSADIPAGVRASGTRVIRGAWGGRPGEFGRKRDDEANPEAPMALAVRGQRLLVVDQVNHRVQRFDLEGRPLGQLAVSETAQDLAVHSGDRTVVLDRLADQRVQVYDAEGRLVNEAPIVGEGLAEGGAATGVFADDEGIWVEREHGALVRVADPNGNADGDRRELPGRPTLDGKRVVTAAIVDRDGGRLAVTAFERGTLAVRWAVTLGFRMPILHVLTVESDASGNVYAVVDLGREATTAPYALVEEAVVVVKLDVDGRVAGTIELPAAATGDESLRPITVGEDGSIYRMVPSSEGMTIERYAVR